MDLVSIIVPVYNVDKYISKCLDSLIEQTYSNIQIILVNDGSNDLSGEICEKYAKLDERIEVFHQQNCGVSKARNIGLMLAKGEYICFVDPDDYVLPDYVDYLIKLIKINNSDISLTTEFFTTFKEKKNNKDKIKVVSSEEATILILTYNIPIGVYCKMFKREFLEKNSIKFEEDLQIGEGFNFNTYSFQRANNVTIGKRKIYFYRRNNPTSATSSFSLKKSENALYAINKIKEKQLIKTKRMNVAIEYALWHTTRDAFDMIVLSKSEKQYDNFYKKCKSFIRKNAFLAFKVNICFKERIRAVIVMIIPRFIPWLMNKRNKKYEHR